MLSYYWYELNLSIGWSCLCFAKCRYGLIIGCYEYLLLISMGCGVVMGLGVYFWLV